METQISFDPLDFEDGFTGPLLAGGPSMSAKHVRNARLRELRAAGKSVYGWCLRGQLRPYKSFGVPDGRVRTVYYITVRT